MEFLPWENLILLSEPVDNTKLNNNFDKLLCLSSSLWQLVFEYLDLIAFSSHGNFPSHVHFIQKEKKKEFFEVYLRSPSNRKLMLKQN